MNNSLGCEQKVKTVKKSVSLRFSIEKEVKIVMFFENKLSVEILKRIC